MKTPRITVLLRLGTLVALCALGAGCKTGEGGIPDYATSARENYERAVVEMKKENYADAVKLFSYVRSKFSFSKYATLAELGVADAHFGQEKYMDAVEDYRTFIKNHPTHERVVDGYADFRIGESFYKEIPSEWFLVPPAYEKDMGPVRDALRELAAFVVAYPASPHIEKAKKLQEDCVRRLAEHEIYVADFYMKRNKPVAAIGRLESLVTGSFLPRLASESGDARDRLSVVARNYLRKNMEPEVLMLLARTYLKMNKPADAKLAFLRLIEQHPEDFRAKKAQLFLAKLENVKPPEVAPRSLAPQPAAPEKKPPGEAEPAPETPEGTPETRPEP